MLLSRFIVYYRAYVCSFFEFPRDSTQRSFSWRNCCVAVGARSLPVFIDVEETPQVVDKAFHSSSANGGARDKMHSAEEKSTEKEKKKTKRERERERESRKKRGRVKGSRLFSETSRRGATSLFLDEDSVSGRVINLYNYCFL